MRDGLVIWSLVTGLTGAAVERIGTYKKVTYRTRPWLQGKRASTLIDSGLATVSCASGQGKKTRGCRRVAYPESYITQHTTYTKIKVFPFHSAAACVSAEYSVLFQVPSFRQSDFPLMFQKPIPTQIRRIILFMSNIKG